MKRPRSAVAQDRVEFAFCVVLAILMVAVLMGAEIVALDAIG